MNATEINYKIREEVQIKAHNRSPKYVYNEQNLYYNILMEYLEYLHERNLAESTIYVAKRNCIYFLNYIENQKIKNINNIKSTDIEGYISNIRQDLNICTKKTYLKDTRLLLKYFYYKKYTEEDLSLFLPVIKVPSYNIIPNTISTENLKKIFNAINRNTKHGKEIYAIFLLALRYGLRPSDIKNLKFDNIYWKERKIQLIQSKTKVSITLPLTDDVANALIDYIKNSRVKSQEPYIFLSNKGTKYHIHNSFYNDYEKILKKANIELPEGQKKGIYSLRHTLASTLLKENIPLPIISSALGHSSAMSTMNYLKVDLNQLKTCCLEMEDIYEKR